MPLLSCEQRPLIRNKRLTKISWRIFLINFDKQLSDQKTQHLWFFACQKASLHLGFSSWELNICYARPPKVLLLLQTYVQVQLTVQTPNFSITLTFLFHISIVWKFQDFFMSFRFYVKSILKNLKVLKMLFMQFQ